MRVALHEEAVLVGAGFGLVAVDHEVAGPDRRHEPPLDPGREAGPTATEEDGLLDLGGDLVGWTSEGGPQPVVASGVERAGQGVAVGVTEPAGDDLRAFVVDVARSVRHIVNCSATGLRSGWLLTISGISQGSSPERWRSMRS